MVQRVGGFRRDTRRKLKKGIRQKGKISLTRYLQQFNRGDHVQLQAEPAVQKGMYYPRFYGKAGKIIGKRGECYEVRIVDGNMTKTVMSHPVHLKRL